VQVSQAPPTLVSMIGIISHSYVALVNTCTRARAQAHGINLEESTRYREVIEL